MRVAALADVHGNAPALAAVLEEVERERPDLVVFCGDLTWGALPQETLALVRALELRRGSCAGTPTAPSVRISRGVASGWPRRTPPRNSRSCRASSRPWSST
jgi:3',5'-cyclic AMP phosphodiesterase CpdA